jgi:hypothetical protein
MSTYIQCPKCGHNNKLGRLFCERCSQRLEMTDSKMRVMHSPGEWLKHHGARVSRALIALVLLGIIGLILWPVAPAGRAGTQQDAEQLRVKMVALSQAVENRMQTKERITEMEANAYLEEIVRNTKQSMAGGQMEIRTINLRLQKQAGITVLLSTGLGPLNLTYEILGKPARGGSGFSLQPEAARMGHLPVPGSAMHWLARRVSVVFSRLDRERRLLGMMQRIDIQDGSADLITRAP